MSLNQIRLVGVFMKFEKVAIGIDTNSYIVYDEDTLEAIIIDPGSDCKKIINVIDRNKLKPKEIVLTHYHYDHIGAVDELKEYYNCIVAIHKNDVQGLKDPKINQSKKGLKRSISITPDKILLDKSVIKAGAVKLRVIHTPGHTQGSICLKASGEEVVFTGDTIFDNGVGRWDLIGGDEKKMKSTLINKVNRWEDKITIYPGHGNCASMEYVKRENKEFAVITRQ